jgi:hypothetical protein
MDSGSRRPAEVHMIADSSRERVIRFDVDDDPLSKANREAETRINTQWMPDSRRADALNGLVRKREHAAWLERFNRERLARGTERHDSSTDEDKSVRRLEWRLRNQWRANFDPNGYERGREKP